METIERVRLYQLGVRLHGRGYLLNADSAELRSVLTSRASRDAAVRDLTTMMARDVPQQRQIAALRTMLDSADALAAALRVAATSADRDQIRAMLTTTGRTSLAATIDAQIDSLLSAERAVLVQRTTQQHRADALTLAAAAIGVVLAAGIGLTTLRFRRRNTKEIASASATFQRLAEENPDGVLVHVGYTVVYANAAMRAMLRAGHSMIGRHVRDLVHPDDRAVIDRRTEQVSLQRTQTTPQLIRFLRDDGTVSDAEARGAPIAFNGSDAIQVVLRDLTARRDTERALQQSEQRFRAVLDVMDEGVVLYGDDLSIGLSNPAAQRILGLTAEQLAGQSPRDAAWRIVDGDGEELPSARQYTAVAMRTAVPTSGIMGVDRPSQGRVWVSVTAIPLFRDGNTAPMGVVATFSDITDRLALEDRLRQAEKMEGMGRMASGVAHDFNNLLTIIRSASELLRMETPPTGVASETLADIEAATERAAALTAHLLTFSRRQHATPVLVPPAQLIREALPILRRLAGETVRVEYQSDSSADAAWIWAEPVRFEQVLVNLVSNAKDAMPGGGTVQIRTGAVALQDSVTHRFGVISPGRYVTLTVQDTGLGMSADVLTHLFDPFYTTKPQGRGTGLGLSIVYGVVTEALGAITVESTPNEGSQLTVYWPRAEHTAPTPTATHSDPAPAYTTPTDIAAVAHSTPATTRSSHTTVAATLTGSTISTASVARRRTILLVDDEEGVRRVVAKQIEASGYAVITAGSGHSALAMLRNPAFDIELVVSDVRMPEMSGIELVRVMVAEQIHRPVLLVSGQMDTQLPRSFATDATVRFLPKPLSGIALRRVIGELIDQASRA
jgi:two-component system cell cycle sensor histidine kinase/response regulator CckA